MRILLLLLFIFINTYVNAQEPLTYTEVIEVEGVDKETLFKRAKEWVSITYRSAQDVTQNSDEATATVILKAAKEYNSPKFTQIIDGYIRYTLQITAKDGRYKYTITNFVHKSSGVYSTMTKSRNYVSFGLITDEEEYTGKPDSNQLLTKKWNKKVVEQIKLDIKIYCLTLIKEMKEFMAAPTQAEDDNW